MDYVKEIERIQREQEQAIRAAQVKTEQAALAALANAGAAPPLPPPAPAPAPGKAASRQSGKAQAQAQVRHAAARALASSPPGALAFVARVVRAVLLIPIFAALVVVIGSAMEAWDGYYLHPGELVSVIVPLLIIIGLLKLRRRLADPQSWGREAASPGAKQAVQSTVDRWIGFIVVLVIAMVFLEDVFPRGLPLGEWLGLRVPSTGA